MIGHRTAYTYSGNSDQKLAYNANDLVRSATLNKEVQDGKSVQYGYDRVGNPTSIRYPNQRLVEREFDLLNRISRVKQGNDIVSTMEFLGRSYRLASKGYQNGDLVKYLYDQGRRLTSSETKNKNQAILQSFGWGYDSLDLKSFEKRIHNAGKGDAFSYDALKRLTNVTFDSPTPETPTATVTRSKAITLDKLDNILKITDNENAMVTEIIGELEGKGKALNQYSKFNDLPLEYDTNGNLSAKGSRLFAYDYRNRLIRSSRGDDAVTFTYDIFGRQTSRTDLSGTYHFFYAGDQKIEERNASGQVNKQYVWGNGIDELLRLDIYNGSSSTPYYVHTDAIGSTTAITDASGNLVERVTYDVYGAPTFTDALGQTLKKSTIRNTTLFQGREYDYDLALYNYRARYYDPTMGRFLQTDPLGYQDSMNLYQGMGMNPVNFVDPWGEAIIKLFLGFSRDAKNQMKYKAKLFTINPHTREKTYTRQTISPYPLKNFEKLATNARKRGHKFELHDFSDETSQKATEAYSCFTDKTSKNNVSSVSSQDVYTIFVGHSHQESDLSYSGLMFGNTIYKDQESSKKDVIAIFSCNSNEFAGKLFKDAKYLYSYKDVGEGFAKSHRLMNAAYAFILYIINNADSFDKVKALEAANQGLAEIPYDRDDKDQIVLEIAKEEK